MKLSNIGRGFSYLVVQNVIQVIIAIVFYSIAAKSLIQSDLGFVSTLNFLHIVFTVIAPLALPIAGTKYISELIGRNKKAIAANVAKTVLRLVLFLSLLFLSVFCIFSFILLYIFNWPQENLYFLIITYIASFVATLRLTYLAFIQGLQCFEKYAVTNLFTLILSRTIGLFLILKNFGITGFVIGIFIGETFGLFLTIFYYYGSLPKAMKLYKSKLLLKFSIPIYIMNVVTTFSDWIDRAFFLLLSYNLEALGIYELSIRGASSLLIFVNIIDVVILPVFSEIYGKKGKKELKPLFEKAMRYVVFIYFPAAIGLASISKTAMALLFGWRYTVGSAFLAILSIFSILTAFSSIIGSALKSVGETKIFLKASLTALMVNSIIVTLFTPIFGLYGAILGRLASIIIIFVYVLFELNKTINIDFDLQGLWKGVFASLTIIVPLQIIEVFISRNSYNPAVSLTIEVFLGFICYVFALFLLKALNKDDFKILRRLTPKSLLKIIDFLERFLV